PDRAGRLTGPRSVAGGAAVGGDPGAAPALAGGDAGATVGSVRDGTWIGRAAPEGVGGATRDCAGTRTIGRMGAGRAVSVTGAETSASSPSSSASASRRRLTSDA